VEKRWATGVSVVWHQVKALLPHLKDAMGLYGTTAEWLVTKN
jgi:hypothetical protein